MTTQRRNEVGRTKPHLRKYRVICVIVREDRQGEGLILTANDHGVQFTAPKDATYGYVLGSFTARELLRSLKQRLRNTR